MIDRHLKKNAPQHVIGELQIPEIRYCCALLWWLQPNPRTTANAVRLWSVGKPHSLLAGMKAGQALCKAVWQILTQLNISYHMIQQLHSLVFTQLR